MSTIYIPDTLRNWPWKREASPHFEQCKIEASEWSEGFRAFSPNAQKAFDKCDFCLLGALAYPKMNKDGCRVGCDLMILFFLFDEWSDASTLEETRVMADIQMDALRNPYKSRPNGEWVGGEITRQFWVNALRTATPIAQRRFIKTYEEYLDAVVQQSEDRGHHRIRKLDDFLILRRKTAGVKPSFAINELHMNIPDYVMEHDIIQSLTEGCVDMICIDNDLYSYNAEQAIGDTLHNSIATVMHQFKLDEQGAFDYIGKLRDQITDKFMENYRNIPSWGAGIDEEVKMYVDAMANWVRANTQWSFEGQRYFGTDGLRVLEERIVMLLPKREFSCVKPDELGARIGGDRLDT